jgi:D-cysteine desulfhydrase
VLPGLADCGAMSPHRVGLPPSSGRLLVERWPALRPLPVSCARQLPTPLEPLEGLDDVLRTPVWVKRDDLTDAAYGGNKTRKLEWLLAEAQAERAGTLVTIGAVGSHHVLATAVHGRRVGLKVEALLVPRGWSDEVEKTTRAALDAGAVLHAVPNLLGAPGQGRQRMNQLRKAGERPFWIPAGGSNATGALGFVEAGLELAEQLVRREGPEPAAILLPYGTGATAAGLAVGLAAAGAQIPIVAVRVTERVVATRRRLRRLVDAVVERLRGQDEGFPAIASLAWALLEVDGAELGKGYGQPTEGGRLAAKVAAEGGLDLDQTYGAKAFHAIIRRARVAGDRPLLFWHTRGAAPAPPASPSTIPYAIRQLLRA